MLIVISVVVFVVSIASVAYTLTQSFPTIKAGSPSQSLTDSVFEVLMPLNMTNKGILSISDLYVTGTLKAHDGTPLVEVVSNRLTIPPGGAGTLQVRVTLNASSVTPELMKSIMVDDQNLQIAALLKGSVQPFLNVLVSANDTMRWGAPYKDLQMGEPALSVYNDTHLLVKVPISFKNNSTIFSVSGTGEIKVVDEGYRVVGYGWTYMDVRPGSGYSGTIDLCLEAPWIGHPELLTQSVSKNYTITTRLPSPLIGEFEQTQTVTMEWGAPISEPQIGEFFVSTHNSTHARIFIPLSFKDASVLPLTGTLRGVIFDLSGDKVGEIEGLQLVVQPGQTYVGTMAGYVSNASASQQRLKLRIILDVPYGTLEKELMISAKGS
ncbi:MAG: hypothetical protein ACP5KV_02490 [Candidatus Methanomethylicaceae archaeon]